MLHVHTILCLLLINVHSVLTVKAAELHCKDGSLICYSLESSGEEEDTVVSTRMCFEEILFGFCAVEERRKGKCKTSLNFTKARRQVGEGTPTSHLLRCLSSAVSTGTPNGTLPFHAVFCSLSAS